MPGTSPRTPKRWVEPIEMRSTAQRLNPETPTTKKPPRGGSAWTGFADGSMHYRIVQYRKYTDRAKLSTGFPCGEEKSESNA